MPRLAALLDQAMNQPVPEHPIGPNEPDTDGDDAHGGNDNAPDSEVVRLALEFAEASMDHHGLDGPPRDDVRRFVRLDEHCRIIELYVSIESLKRQSGVNTAAYDFVKSQAFLGHMHANPEAWKIPPEIIHNNDQWEIFAAAVRVRLTTLRSQTRDRAFKGQAKGLDINQILYQIAPKQAILCDAHRARWAWILLSIDDFKQAYAAGEKYEKGDFWDFLEDQLAAAKKAIAANPQFTTDAIRSQKFAEVFICALAEHRRMYPTRITRGRTGERAAWQATIEEAMGMGREIYTNVMAPDA
ncbi:hypothetical protein FRC09_015190 [Ceratobasidium sp. 395]|nr:hypothetical protein FRC09_015190 [Ceratobasidium sp. 395]